MATVDEVYEDRNRLALLAFTLAYEAGYEVGIISDPTEPGWPVLAINLPTGQVSWHVPAALFPAEKLEAVRSKYPRTWDGHSNEVKAERILDYAFKTPISFAHLRGE